MEVAGLGEVSFGIVEPSGEQFGFAAQDGPEGVAAGGAEPTGLGGEGVGERDDVVVGPSAVEKPLSYAQLPVEDTSGEMREVVGVARSASTLSRNSPRAWAAAAP